MAPDFQLDQTDIDASPLSDHEKQLLKAIDVEKRPLIDVAKQLGKDKSTISIQHKKALEKAIDFIEKNSKKIQKTRLASTVFSMIERGKSLTDIVAEIGADPDEVESINRKFIKLKRQDLNLPSVPKTVAELENRLETLEAVTDWMSRSIDLRQRDDHSGCKYLGDGGYCTNWSWPEKVSSWIMRSEQVDGKTIYRLNVKAHKFMCASCPSYTPRGSG